MTLREVCRNSVRTEFDHARLAALHNTHPPRLHRTAAGGDEEKYQNIFVTSLFWSCFWRLCWNQGWLLRAGVAALEPEVRGVIALPGWSNWDGSLRCSPHQIATPERVDEVCDLVRGAVATGTTVRALGAGHSWSPLVPTNGIILSLDRMASPLRIDERNRLAEVQGGMRLRALGPYLRQHGLTLRNLGAITAQSIAGAVSTGTHGMGIRYGNLGTQVTAMTIVDGTGEVREFNAQDHRAEMSALRLSLGCLGIIMSVTIECVADHNVALVHYPLAFSDFLDGFEDLAENERVRVYWFPGSDVVFVNTMNRTDEQAGKGPLFSWFEAVVLRRFVMGSLWTLGRWCPPLIRPCNAFQERVGFTRGSVVGPCFEAITAPMPPHHREAEVAVPIENAKEAVVAFRDLVKRRGLLGNVPCEIRFVHRDDIMLSLSYGTDVCYIGIYSARGESDGFFQAVCSEMGRFDGRPHWGKLCQPDRAMAQARFERFGEFEELRRSFDPKGVFLNGYLKELFR